MRNKLLSSLAVAVFSFATSGLAIAADMPVKAPPAPPPAPVYNWTGWYVGVNAGASMGNVKTDVNGAPIFWTQAPPHFGQILPALLSPMIEHTQTASWVVVRSATIISSHR